MDMSDPLQFIRSRAKNFELPDMEGGVAIIPVSGGADSTFLALTLHTLYPEVPWKMVFTDTGTQEYPVEEPEIHLTLDRLETYVGRKIERLVPEQGLHEKIVAFHGFLPGANSRWCTRELKQKPFSKWLQQFKGVDKYIFVAFRSDEKNRLAFSLEQCETLTPLRDMGLVREDIFEGMRRTVGIPKLYSRRTRTGCKICPFQRKQELIGLLQQEPESFLEGERYETVAASDLARWDEGVPLWSDTRIAKNWQHLPQPDAGSIEGRTASRVPDLFGSRIYVCGEFFMDGAAGLGEFCWKQGIVSVAPTLHHIKRQLDARFEHLLSTAEVHEMSPADVRSKVKFAIWCVELPSDCFDPEGPKQKGYTWQSGWAFRQLRHIISWTTRALNAEALRQQARKKVRSECSVQAEWRDSAQHGLEAAQFELGQVVASQWYVPTEKVKVDVGDDEEITHLPCPMCTI